MAWITSPCNCPRNYEMVKRTRKGDRERKVRSTRFAHLWSLPSRDLGCLLALAGRYKHPTRLPFLGLPSVIMRYRKTADQGSSLAACRVCHSFTQAHQRVSKTENVYTEKAERLELWVFLPCPEDPGQALKMIAYGERCQYIDLWRRFNFGTRDQACSHKSFCVAGFY